MTALTLNEPDLLRDAAFVAGTWLTGSAHRGYQPRRRQPGGPCAQRWRCRNHAGGGCRRPRAKAWAKETGKARALVLRRWADLILAHADDLARLMTAEQGKPLAEARGEVAMPPASLNGLPKSAPRHGRDPHPPSGRSPPAVRKEPVGVVAAVTPWNFPLAMITRKAGPALAAAARWCSSLRN
jgi:succinate-semialdehyde dehydrogenase/glutarate-semialdehyde dehydrogenase